MNKLKKKKVSSNKRSSLISNSLAYGVEIFCDNSSTSLKRLYEKHTGISFKLLAPPPPLHPAPSRLPILGALAIASLQAPFA
jgi:hypothetical protein